LRMAYNGDFVAESIRNLQIGNWHESDEFKILLQNFEREKAHYPKDHIQQAKQILNEFLTSLLQDKDMELSKCDGQGSVYEGLKINSTPLEFDAMCVLNWSLDDCELLRTNHAGYFCIKPQNLDSPQFKGILDRQGLLPPRLLIPKFFGKLQKFVNKKYPEIRLYLHGCAIQIKLKMNISTSFDVDIVPGLEYEGELFVCRNHPDDVEGKSWRKSTSKEEVEKMKHLDDDGGCRKDIIRIFKALKDSTPNGGQLKTLSTYVMKTAILHISDDKSIEWEHENIHKCFHHTLEALITMLKNRKISNYFVPKQNLLTDHNYSEDVMQTIVLYLEKLQNSEERMRRTLKV